ncbi:MAG: type VI secretion system baseplate subunit TssE [Azoarcus sp.]|jgi:type VI secretion system protein ImpF|nr:type VI secretion system baseplate subunit TssE [Azoarcus sp.]
MSYGAGKTMTLPSVLDRLLDDAPDQPGQDAVLAFNLSDFKAALARDLESLLNTRVMGLGHLARRYPLAAQSVINYGIPDLSSLSLLNPDHRELLRAQIRRAIEFYDKRLSDVRVNFDFDTEGNTERLLHFRVDALLKVHPHRPPVSFDATLQLSSNAYQVQGAR